MNNMIIIAYNGKKPSKREVEAIGNTLMTMGFCNEVEVIKHYDRDSIVDIVGKGTTIIGFESNDDEALKNAAIFINAHFDNAWDMIGKAAIARKVPFRSEEQQALLNAIDIIASKSAKECEQYGILPIIHNACYNIKYHILNID